LSGYETAHVDELEVMPVNGGEFVWRPVRRRFDISAFGSNAYSAEKAGQRVIEEHFERDGHEEMYVVLRGRATFTLDGEEVDAAPGTLVFVRPGTTRGAVAAEDDTAILAVGAKPGVVFEPSRWEDLFAAASYASQGDLERARSLIAETLAEHRDEWQGHYEAACIEAKAGDADRALAHLRRAAEINRERVENYAREDTDFARLRDDPRFESALTGQPDAGGAGA
jgi:mannose-6-phosphate isomerase-like protein (cupin superfamily)